MKLIQPPSVSFDVIEITTKRTLKDILRGKGTQILRYPGKMQCGTCIVEFPCALHESDLNTKQDVYIETILFNDEDGVYLELISMLELIPLRCEGGSRYECSVGFFKKERVLESQEEYQKRKEFNAWWEKNKDYCYGGSKDSLFKTWKMMPSNSEVAK